MLPAAHAQGRGLIHARYDASRTRRTDRLGILPPRAPLHPIHRHRLIAALHLLRADALAREFPFAPLPRRFTHEDVRAGLLREAFDPRGEVHRVTDDRVLVLV